MVLHSRGVGLRHHHLLRHHGLLRHHPALLLHVLELLLLLHVLQLLGLDAPRRHHILLPVALLGAPVAGLGHLLGLHRIAPHLLRSVLVCRAEGDVAKGPPWQVGLLFRVVRGARQHFPHAWAAQG